MPAAPAPAEKASQYKSIILYILKGHIYALFWLHDYFLRFPSFPKQDTFDCVFNVKKFIIALAKN